MNPKYPIYIVSKGRAKIGTTYKAFDKLKMPYYIVVEQHEYQEYVDHVEPQGYGKVLILDPQYQIEYDTFDDLGHTKSKGPGPARNFCWDDSIARGHQWHWVFDDNIGCFYRLNKNRRLPIGDGTMFRVMEDFCDRYENVAQAGPNYMTFVRARHEIPPYVLNWRVYSMLLIRNDIPYRWRGRYNEDTDLSLRVMNDGWCTIQFNAFMGDKAATQTMDGGNSDAFYFKEGTYNKSKMLVDMHPNHAKLVETWDRWHHKVDYTKYKQKLILKPNLVFKDEVNNYGMELIEVDA